MSVRIESVAFSDLRFERLARACGLADGDHARGKIARLWEQCTLSGSYTLPIDDVIAVLGDGAVDALVRSDLGEISRGMVRMKGTKGRVEWRERL